MGSNKKVWYKKYDRNDMKFLKTEKEIYKEMFSYGATSDKYNSYGE